MSRLSEKYHINIWMYSYSQVQGTCSKKRCRTTGQIRPVLSTRIWTLSPRLENNHTFKCWSGIFSTILTYIIMLDNCQNNISVYDCSPIQGTKLYFCWNFLKPWFQSRTYKFANVSITLSVLVNKSSQGNRSYTGNDNQLLICFVLNILSSLLMQCWM